MAKDNIIIGSPIGDITIPKTEVKEFVTDLFESAKKNDSTRTKRIYDFFGGNKPRSEYHSMGQHEVSPYLKCVNEVLKRDYDILEVTNYTPDESAEIPVRYHEFDVGFEQKEPLMLEGCVFVQHKKLGHKYALCFEAFMDRGIHVEIEAFFDSTKTTFKNLWDVVEDYFETEGPLRNQKIDAKWGYLGYDESDWSDIIIKEDLQKLLKRNIVNYINNIEEYAHRNLPTSRGILITGPPGTGKTLCCKTIMSMVNCTTIYVTSDNIENVGDIKKTYKIAKRLSPTIIIIEDIDTLGGLDRREQGNHPLLGEFLNCLNGIGSNSGVVTIATTNFPQHLDAAIADRPGRFDLRLDFGLPDEEQRLHILKKYIEDVEHNGVDLKSLANKTNGLSGAYLREIVMTSYMIALEEDTLINKAIMERALSSIESMRKVILKGYGISEVSELNYC